MTAAEHQWERGATEFRLECANCTAVWWPDQNKPRSHCPGAPWIVPCGGCGETDPAKRCMGCFHDFGDESSLWVHKYGGQL